MFIGAAWGTWSRELDLRRPNTVGERHGGDSCCMVGPMWCCLWALPWVRDAPAGQCSSSFDTHNLCISGENNDQRNSSKLKLAEIKKELGWRVYATTAYHCCLSGTTNWVTKEGGNVGHSVRAGWQQSALWGKPGHRLRGHWMGTAGWGGGDMGMLWLCWGLVATCHPQKWLCREVPGSCKGLRNLPPRCWPL